MTIQVLHRFLESHKGFLQSNSHINKQIVLNSLESGMRFLLDGEYKVTYLHVRDLFGLLGHYYGVTSSNSSLNCDLNELVVLNYTLAFAVRTFGLHGLSFSIAFAALYLHLHIHSKTHFNHLHHNSLSLTGFTLFELAVLCARPPTLRAVYILIDV